MTNFCIPIDKLEELTKKINTIKNKGADVTFNVGKENTVEHELSNGTVVAVKCKEVEVEGKYQVDEWRFVATIEHSGSGNIIRAFDTSLEGQIPSKYRTAGQECEHCNQIRDRKDTYLVYNEKTKDFKQVGRTCLRGYTNGLDAERCAMFADVMNYFIELETEDTKEEFGFGGFSSGAYDVKTDSIKKIIFGYVKANGYVPQQTGRELTQILFGSAQNTSSEASESEVKEMNAWVSQLKDTSNDYMWNAKTAWTKEYAEYRDIALLASFVKVFLKDKSQEVVRQAQKETGNDAGYVGNVGDKIVIKNLKSVRVLFIKDNSQYGYNASSSYLLELIDSEGHVYVWSTTIFLRPDKDFASLGKHDEALSNVESITATVKEHKEYKGVKQTVITRGKVKWKWQDELKSSEEPKTENIKEVFNFLSTLED
jgi:hypothetical protein